MSLSMAATTQANGQAADADCKYREDLMGETKTRVGNIRDYRNGQMMMILYISAVGVNGINAG